MNNKTFPHSNRNTDFSFAPSKKTFNFGATFSPVKVKSPILIKKPDCKKTKTEPQTITQVQKEEEETRCLDLKNSTTTTLKEGKSWFIRASLPSEISLSKTGFEEIWNMKPKDRAATKIMGEIHRANRWNQSYGKSYKFSGIDHPALPIENPFMKSLLDFVRFHSGEKYNQILVNWYADGSDTIGFHSDDEKSMVKNSPIYSFSFGQGRDFVIKSIKGEEKYTLFLENNSLVIMGGEMQSHYKHSVPKRALSKCPGRRINFTLRLFIDE